MVELALDVKPPAEWGEISRKAGRNAYRRACPAVTPRQIEAFAVGRRQLRLVTELKPKDNDADAA